MTRTLMLSDDELSYVLLTTGEFGFELLASELVVDGEVNVADDPVAHLPAELPTVGGGADQIRWLRLLVSGCGASARSRRRPSGAVRR